jgi:7,8-dihydropterin-6-yl-methyl-4-(beta-D-ribofuranosyl)aminobenzene 5'-phosphate synthase
MRVTIIYDNTVYKKGLEADWGFSCLVELPPSLLPKGWQEPVDKEILFDAGANGKILLSNMKKLNIDSASIDEVFISHAHFDHTGGLSAFLNLNNNVIVYAPISLRGVRGVKELIYINESLKIHENVFSTGELQGIEQSLVIKTEKGTVIIVGCSHPGIGNILKSASQFGKPYALIGGFHGFSEFELVKDLEVICPTHCTQYIDEIKSLYPEKYVAGGAGKIIELLP